MLWGVMQYDMLPVHLGFKLPPFQCLICVRGRGHKDSLGTIVLPMRLLVLHRRSQGNGIIVGGLCEQELHSVAKGDAAVLPVWGEGSGGKALIEEVTQQ